MSKSSSLELYVSVDVGCHRPPRIKERRLPAVSPLRDLVR
jgi:hypothetical protein